MKFGILAIVTITALLACPAAADKLVFTSTFGGDHTNGAVIGYDFDTGQLETLASLDGSPLMGLQLFLSPELELSGGMIKGADGMYYGVDPKGRLL
jgi:hypothetical protein